MHHEMTAQFSSHKRVLISLSDLANPCHLCRELSLEIPSHFKVLLDSSNPILYKQRMIKVIQLKITLAHTEPPIWRRLLVLDSITFFDLHHIFQITMGWKNAHLFD